MQGGYTNPLRKRLGGHVLYDADSSAQVSLKGALHLLAKLARPARSYLMGAGAVPSGRCGIASCTRRWVSFSSKSATPLGEGRGCLVGRLGRATRFRCSCHKPADLHRRSRAMLEGVRAIHCPKRNRLGPERDPKLVRVHYNLRLRRKRSNPDFEDVHLAAMTIDPIDEAADDLIVEDDSDSDY